MMENGFYASENDEGPYTIGPCATHDELWKEIKSELQDELAEGMLIAIGKGRPVPICIDGDSLLNQLADSHYDDLYEDALSNWCLGVSSEAKSDLSSRLTDVLHKWLEENGENHTFFVIDYIGDHTDLKLAGEKIAQQKIPQDKP